MKKILLLTLSLVFTITLSAQENVIDKYFSAYQKDKNFTKISITSAMFDFFNELDAEDPEEKEILEALSKIEGIKGLIKENADNSMSLYNEALKKVSGGAYVELMTVEDPEENLKFMIREEGEKIAELLLLNGPKNRFLIMTLYGEIDLNKMYKIAKAMDLKGLDGFQMLRDKE